MEFTDGAEESMIQAHAMMAKPSVTEELAIGLVKDIYGLKVTNIRSLNSFSDQNFHIKVSTDHNNPNIDQISDDGYTLKVINTLKSNLKEHFDAIHRTLIRLHEKGLRVPQPIRNLDGTTWKLETVPLQKSEVELAKTLKCGIHLLTYIPGEPMANNENNEKMFFQWGELLAKFHMSLKDFDCPELMRQYTFITAKNFRFTKGLLDSMPPEAKPLVEDVLDRFLSDYEKDISDLPQGFVHGDFNDHNILLRTTETGSCCADGILDFHDMHHGPYAWDLGAMLGHVLLAKTTLDPLEAVGHAVAGYQSVRKMSEKELSLLKIGMESRVCLLCYVTTIAEKEPSNSYIVNAAPLQPKIDILKRLSSVDNKSLLKIYDYPTKRV